MPFYSWVRAGFLLYLIAPQTQGAKVLYQSHVHPFLQEHENSIEDFIASAHAQLKTAGLNYLKQAIELLKQNLLGQAPSPQSAPTPASASTPARSYTQTLIARFNLPDARPAFPTPSMGGAIGGAQSSAENFYGLLASAVSAVSGSGTKLTPVDHDDAADQLNKSGTLIPPSLSGADRLSFISDQRERLSILLTALNKEASNAKTESTAQSPKLNTPEPSMVSGLDGTSAEPDRPASAMGALSRNKSEADFEKIEYDIASEERPVVKARSGSWMPWSWGGRGVQSVDAVVESDAAVVTTTKNDTASSSATDL